MAEPRVDLDEPGFAELANSTQFRDALLDIGTTRVARPAAAEAPVRTGLGKSTIHAEALIDGGEWTVRASWTRQAWYLRFHEQGTRHMRADPFLQPTVEGFQ